VVREGSSTAGGTRAIFSRSDILQWTRFSARLPWYEKAIEWYEKAAAQEEEHAQFFLGDAYYDGQGVPQDYEKAIDWYEKAATQEEEHAQFALGKAYYNGRV
jgi:TPR repeat protein